MPQQHLPTGPRYDRFLRFIELDEFQSDWSRLGLDVERDLCDLQELIMQTPTAPVIPGTGGLRKIRFAPAHWRKGKSGAVRVCYAVFPAYRAAVLVMAYGKAQKSNLSAEERRGIKALLATFEKYLRGSWPARRTEE